MNEKKDLRKRKFVEIVSFSLPKGLKEQLRDISINTYGYPNISMYVSSVLRKEIERENELKNE